MTKELKGENKWRFEKRFSDIRQNGLIEAICVHGVGHHQGVHGCDGCCENCPEEIWSKVSKD